MSSDIETELCGNGQPNVIGTEYKVEVILKARIVPCTKPLWYGIMVGKGGLEGNDGCRTVLSEGRNLAIEPPKPCSTQCAWLAVTAVGLSELRPTFSGEGRIVTGILRCVVAEKLRRV
jgi:hypothetical protein